MLNILILIVSPTPDFEEIVKIGERGTIFLATIAILTLTYAAASEYPEKNVILKSGKDFYKSVLYFLIGMIFLIGSRKALTNPFIPFGLPEFVDNIMTVITIISLFLLMLIGFALLTASASLFSIGLKSLIKSLQNKNHHGHEKK